MSKFCKYCMYWTESYKTHDRLMGTCRHDPVIYSIEKDTEQSHYGEGILHTDQYFGCIYFRKGEMNVVDIKAMAQEFVEKIMPKEELKICSSCNAANCINNLTCHQCNTQF